MKRTYYDRLGIGEDASQEEIEDAYRELAKKVHPDKSDDPNAGDQFIRIKEAYEVLSNPAEREAYDKLGHERYVEQNQRPERGTQETGDVTFKDIDWQAHTRESDSEARGQRNKTQSPEWTDSSLRSDLSQGFVRWIVAYSLVIFPVFVLSTFVWGGGLELWGGSTSDQPFGTFADWVGLTTLTIVVFFGVVTVAERLLNTPEQFSPTLHDFFK